MKMNLKTVAIAASAFACAGLLSFNWSEQGGISISVKSAQACRVGRPLTPMSAAWWWRVAIRMKGSVRCQRRLERPRQPGPTATIHYPSNGQGFVCEPGTYFHGEDGRQHLCQ